MGISLSRKQVESYRDNGFVHALPVFSADEARCLRDEIEALEQAGNDTGQGRSMRQYFRVNGHVVLPLLADLARTPAILDAVEDVLGPDLLAWSVELFIKEPRSENRVSWHQDLTYWGMGETDDEVTAWIALSDVSIEAGCMRFIPGSHKGGLVVHRDSVDAANMLSRGQSIDNIDETQAVHAPLAPGQMSMHHGRCFHASGANHSDERRIGLAIRYVTPHVRQPDLARDYAMLVRGRDSRGGWINIAGPRDLLAEPDITLYEEILEHQKLVLTAGAAAPVSGYDDRPAMELPA